MKYLSFLPGYAVPPLVSLAFVYTFTRLLTPAEYGTYAVVVSVAQLLLAAVFSWLQLSVKRFYAEAAEQGWVGTLTLAIYAGYVMCALCVVAASFIALEVLDVGGSLRAAYTLGVGLALARAGGVIVKAYRVGGLNPWRYAVLEASESIGGFLAALTLVRFFGWGTIGMLAGVMVGALIPIFIDLRALVGRLRGAIWNRETVRMMLRFGAPFTVGYALEYVMSSSDRLLIDHFLGADAVGSYAVAYTLADRGVSLAFQALAIVSYPLLMRGLATGGADGARRQARENLEILLALAAPAFAGFVIATPQIASVMIGPAFSAEAQGIMPWIATGVFLASLRIHYVDHAFHLAQRTSLVLYCAAPPAVLNVVLNVVLLPRIGLRGAVIATVAAYALALAINVTLARRVFAMPLAVTTAIRVAVAVGAMVGVLRWLSFPATMAGLIGIVLTGALVYGALAILFDIGGLRRRLMRKFGSSETPPKIPTI